MADHKLWFSMHELLKREGISYHKWYMKDVTFFLTDKNCYITMGQTEVEDYLVNEKIEELVASVKLQLLF